MPAPEVVKYVVQVMQVDVGPADLRVATTPRERLILNGRVREPDLLQLFF